MERNDVEMGQNNQDSIDFEQEYDQLWYEQCIETSFGDTSINNSNDVELECDQEWYEKCIEQSINDSNCLDKDAKDVDNSDGQRRNEVVSEKSIREGFHDELKKDVFEAGPYDFLSSTRISERGKFMDYARNKS